MPTQQVTIDGNEAAASVAHLISEVVAIHLIAPPSPTGEWAGESSTTGSTDLWNPVPQLIGVQSKAGGNGVISRGLAVNAGHWRPFRHDPRKPANGENPLHLDAMEPSIPHRDLTLSEPRIAVRERTRPEPAHRFMDATPHQNRATFRRYEQIARPAVGETHDA